MAVAGWSDGPLGDAPFPASSSFPASSPFPTGYSLDADRGGPSRSVHKLDVRPIEERFEAWVSRMQGEIDEGWAELRRDRAAWDEEKDRMRRDFHVDLQSERDRLRRMRDRAEAEHNHALRQARVERDNHKAFLEQRAQAGHNEHRDQRFQHAMERQRFRKMVEDTHKERQKVFENNTDTETAVEINIGGSIFESSRHTLMQQHGSLLERLLSNRVPAPRDRHGRVYLDRDPKIFQILLNFLRSPDAPPVARDAVKSEAIAKEAAFYGIRFYPFPLAFAIGGHNGTDHLSSMEVLDVEHKGWRSCQRMIMPRSYHGAELANGRIFAFGGGNHEYKALSATEWYDMLRGTWQDGPDLLIPRRNCASAVLDNIIYAIGGYDGTNILSAVEAHDPRMKGWMLVERLTTPRSSACAAIVEETIWAMGGTDGERLRSVERFEPRMNKWQPVNADMRDVRSTAKAAICGQRLYVLGGADQRQRVHLSVECCAPEHRSPWSYVQSMPEPRMDFGCCTVGESLMVAGGQDGGQVFPSTEFFRPDLDEWEAGPPMLSPRHGHALLLVNL